MRKKRKGEEGRVGRVQERERGFREKRRKGRKYENKGEGWLEIEINKGEEGIIGR